MATNSQRGKILNNTRNTIFLIIYFIVLKGGKHYCTPSIRAIQELLYQRHNIKVGRSWIFECIKNIEDDGYIARRKRYSKTPDGQVIQKSSIISITLMGARKLYDLGVAGAKHLIKSITNWLHRNDNRFPDVKKQVEKIPEHFFENGLTSVRALLGALKL